MVEPGDEVETPISFKHPKFQATIPKPARKVLDIADEENVEIHADAHIKIRNVENLDGEE